MSETQKTDTLAISGALEPFYVVGIPMSFTPTVSNAQGSVSFSATGILPRGLTVDATTGVLSGTPLDALTYPLVIRATDSQMTVALPLGLQTVPQLSCANTTFVSGEVGVPYSQTIRPTDGYGVLTGVLGTATLPPGLSVSVDMNGLHLNGSPTSGGTYHIPVTYTDRTGTYTPTYTIVIAETLSIDISQAPPQSLITVPYAFTPKITGGVGELQITLTPGLPLGMNLNTTNGAITGQPIDPLHREFTYTVSDALGSRVSASFVIAISRSVSVVYPPFIGIAGQPIDPISPIITGGFGTLSYSCPNGDIPSGLSLDSATGVISGSLLMAQSGAFSVQVQDSSGSAAQNVNYTVYAPLNLSYRSVNFWVGKPLTLNPNVSGGRSDHYQFTCSTPLPPGFAFDSATGTLTAMATTAQSDVVLSITLSDGFQTFDAAIPFTVYNPLSLVPNQLIQCVVGQAIAFPIQYLGGTGTPLWSLSTGKLPRGLTLDPRLGKITGIPQELFSGSIGVTVYEEVNQSQGSVSIQVVSPISITGIPGPITVGVPYSFVPTVTGGYSPKSFSVSAAGAFFFGLNFNQNTGAITGTAVNVQSQPIVISVTDGVGTTTLSATLTSNPALATARALFRTPSSPLSATGQSYVDILTRPGLTENDYARAMQVMNLITQNLMSDPSTKALDELWFLHTTYRDTLFSEKSFFRGSEAVTPQNLARISSLYDAFRTAVVSPNKPYSYTYVNSVLGTSAVGVYLSQKRRTLTA